MLSLILLVNCLFLVICAVFVFESIREKEPRAPWAGAAGAAGLLLLIPVSIWIPVLRWPVLVLLALIIFLAIAPLFGPSRPNSRALQGANGYRVAEFSRFDERDIVFARNRSMHPGTDEYRRYYEKHPEREAKDAQRRQKGGPVAAGGVDRQRASAQCRHDSGQF